MNVPYRIFLQGFPIGFRANTIPLGSYLSCPPGGLVWKGGTPVSAFVRQQDKQNNYNTSDPGHGTCSLNTWRLGASVPPRARSLRFTRPRDTARATLTLGTSGPTSHHVPAVSDIHAPRLQTPGQRGCSLNTWPPRGSRPRDKGDAVLTLRRPGAPDPGTRAVQS